MSEMTKEQIRAEAAEEVLDLLTAHELYRYRPKAFQGFIDYVRTNFSRPEVASYLTEDDFNDIESAASKSMREWERGYVCQDINVRHHISWWVMKETELRVLNSRLSRPEAIGEGVKEAARIGDAVLAWMVKYELLDAGNEYRVEDVTAVLDDFTPSLPSEGEKRMREELTEARAEANMLQDIIDSRPAINAGLPETYIRWSQSIYSGDIMRAALSHQSGNGEGRE